MKKLEKMKQLSFLLLIIGIILVSCQKDDYLVDEKTNADLNIKTESFKNDNKTFPGAKKLKNPYSLKNMQKAWGNIKKKLHDKQIKTKGENAQRLEEGVIDYELSTSHYYVLLRPENAEQEALIKEDPNIHVFDYPLDYEFTDEYLDSRTPDNDSIPEYYTSIILGQELPSGVPHEIIEELYIPEEDPFFDNLSYVRISDTETTKQGEILNGEDLLRHLLMEAYTLTDNQNELLPEGNTTNTIWIFGSKWYPSGNLKIWDDNVESTTTITKTFSHYEYYYCDTGEPAPNPNDPYPLPLKTSESIARIDDNICQRAVYNFTEDKIPGKYIPLEGAQVLMRQWFTVRQGITDANGNFSTGSVRGKARYIIQWERYQYSIRNGSFFQAETRGPKVQSETWNKSIKGGDDEYHGMIHTAAHTYYYGDRLGLTSPPKVTGFFGVGQMKIAAREIDGGSTGSSYSHIRGDLTLGILAQVHIKAWGKSSERVFGTTIHELAHAAHSIVDRGSYDELVRNGWVYPWLSLNNSVENPGPIGNSARRLLETWASTVEIALTVNRYKNKFSQINYTYRKRYSDINNSGNKQAIKILEQNHYTSGGWDMVDDFNQSSLIYGFGNLYPKDRVSGYSINQLENALLGAKSWNDWKENIKTKYSNSTSIYLDELFGNWTD